MENRKPKWVDQNTWNELNERERIYCQLRNKGLREAEMQEEMRFRCGRTWRYFQAQLRKKIFG